MRPGAAKGRNRATKAKELKIFDGKQVQKIDFRVF